MKEDMEVLADSAGRSGTEPEVSNPGRRKMIQGAIGGAAALVPALGMTAAAAAVPDFGLVVTPEYLGDRAGPVRITIPAGVASNLNSLEKGLAAVMERLGCLKCASGIDCAFRIERNFVLEAREGAPAPAGHVPTVEVTWPRQISSSLSLVQSALGKVLGKLGCPTCCSGFDILFRQEVNFLEVGKDLSVRGIGPKF